MGRLVVVVPLKEDKHSRARELLAGGPPFDLDGTVFDRHAVHLTGREAVFVFEGPGPSATLELPGEETELWQAAEAWIECIAEQPRVARTEFSWQRVEGPEGVSFEPTPGVGDSEGGEVYPP
jgi:hypothetical protein